MKRVGWLVLVAMLGAVGGVARSVEITSAAPRLYEVPSLSLDVAATRIELDPTRRVVYASVASVDPTYPNSVVAVDLETWSIVGHAPTASEPSLLAAAADGSTLYVYQSASRTVRQLSLPGLATVREFNLGAGNDGLYQASDIEVLPENRDAIAVALRDRSAPSVPGGVTFEQSAGIAVFDRGLPRTLRIEQITSTRTSIEFGALPSRLYAFEGYPGGQFLSLDVSSTGVSLSSASPYLGDGRSAEYVMNEGLVVSGAVVFDPERSPPAVTDVFVANSFTGFGTPAPDLANGRVFYAGEGDLLAFETGTTGATDSFSLPAWPAAGTYYSSDQMLYVGAGELVLLQRAGNVRGRLLLLLPDSIRGSAGEYTPLTPSRLLDTRDGTGRGGVTTPIGPGQSIDVQMTGGHGIPGVGVDSVVVNATVTEPTSSGFITIWPTGSPRPTISNLNFTPGLTVPNLVTVALGNGGRLSVFNSSGSSHVIFDVAGYYSTTDGPSGARFHSVTPKRLFDTRTGEGGVRRALLGGESLVFDVRGKGGLPAAGVIGIAINVTAATPTQSGYLTVSPADVPRPVVSNLNFVRGQVVPNLVIVRVPPSGLIDFFNFAGSTDVIADVVGFYDLDRSTQHGRLVSYAPYRVLDTREKSPFSGDGRVPPASIIGFGFDDEPATTYVLNVTITGPSLPGYLTVYPFYRPRGFDNPIPDTSNLNFVAGQTVPNLVMVKTGGSIGMYNPFGYTHVIVDFFGEFT